MLSPGMGRPHTCYVWGLTMGTQQSNRNRRSHMRDTAALRASRVQAPLSCVSGSLTSDIITPHDAVTPDAPALGEQLSAAFLLLADTSQLMEVCRRVWLGGAFYSLLSPLIPTQIIIRCGIARPHQAGFPPIS